MSAPARSEIKRKSQVEIEALQEQLRVRREKQYQLLEQVQSSKETKRQAEDQVVAMDDKLRNLHEKVVVLQIIPKNVIGEVKIQLKESKDC